MSGTLVPTGSGNFQQSGQLDWVSLSKIPVTFGFDVLVRLSKAELNPATIAIGRFVCGRFVIKAEAQKRIRDALSSLKSFSSFGNLVWFGFGIKPIVKDLAETEQGLTCVALCACLSISYDSFYVAEVLREICKLQETPSDFIPSLHQWKTLVRMCAGSVSNSKFPTLLEGLMRLAAPSAGASFDQPTTAEALAKAIGALADVSNNKLANTTIAGGLDCMWLAAFSEWCLALDVEVRLSSGSTVYRSSANDDHCLPSVTIVFDSQNEQSIQLSKCHIVPKGCRFWGIPDPDQSRFRGGRSEWTNILADTFGRHMDILCTGAMQENFALLLFHASNLADGCYRYGPVKRDRRPGSDGHSFPFRRFHFSHLSSGGQVFLQFASKRLPELASTIDILNQVEIRTFTSATWQQTIHNLTLGCTCERCQGEEMAYQKSNPVKDIRNTRKHWGHTQPAYFPTYDMDILTAALTVFSGPIESNGKESSALSYDGICVFFKALEDLNLSPEEASRFIVVAGHIHFEGSKYERIRDLTANAGIPKLDIGSHISYTLVAQETPQQGSLAAAYKISSNGRPYGHLLGISQLEHAIAKSIQAPIQCGPSCDWTLLYQTRETVIFVPAPTTQRSGALLPLEPQWSLLSAPRIGKAGQIKLQVMQAPIYQLYLEITKEVETHQLVYLSLCSRCLNGFSPSPDLIHENIRLSQGMRRLPHRRPEGTITVTFPSEIGASMNKCFEIFVVRNFSDKVKEMSTGNGQVPELVTTVCENDKKGISKPVLQTAATVGHRGLMQLLLQTGTEGSTMSGGETPLHCAAGKDHDEVVKLLMVRGAELDSRDKDGQTPLSRAAHKGHKSTVKLMLRYGAYRDSRDNYGQIALVWAAALGHIAVVELLLQEKADINAVPSKNGRTALQAAAEGGHLAVVERLLQEEADVNAAPAVNGRTALQAAAGGGHLAVVERLLQEKADVNAAPAENGRTALQAAAEGGHLAVVERLQEQLCRRQYVKCKV
ncbi:ankyrin repeat-containing protein, putative [Talaromyces stipitatus ATCC 10500]|uniref:Ankyrin repeat-containing protein, putative n=1 Tax=Talaromyces stipitatus (strain ATCC 10500 / CBS 375.48 / QM 6759 / NRRL 1006) TaxID=441959 RepID=B8LXR5_TALSN|nr:ankyrin repeat-containing protein, putative [Talaromyces stipitatus ATCC 10500]EED24650.1 ankyrin repeat-containing protein, putative [Talaromyces stipitatus ATCC 10500]